MRFLLTIFSLYGAMHAYAFVRLRPFLPAGAVRIAAGCLFVAMLLAPILVRVAERGNYELLASFFAWFGYCWMGFLFLLIATLGSIDIFRLASWSVGHLGGALPAWLVLDPRRSALAALLVAGSCAIYGGFDALDIRREEVTLRSAKIPAALGRIRIVQLSDVHLGLMIGRERLQRMLDVVEAAHPDIIVVTGDLVDGQVHRLNGLSEQFRAISPRYGMFAVLGNHEYYAGLPQSLDFMRRSGFRVLRKEAVSVAGCLTIAGVDDPAGARWGDTTAIDEDGLLKEKADTYTILLKHRPAMVAASKGRFDLQLSGHVHKGQIFPFNLVTYLFFPVRAGINPLSESSFLYVSRGTGTWGPPIRFLAPPEVTVIDLLPPSPSSPSSSSPL